MTGSRTLIGRARECRLLDELVAATRGTALVLTGEPGIGKTALLDHAADAAAKAAGTERAAAAVLRMCGVASETVLPFAALADVVLPLRRHLADLPGAQRTA